MSRNGNSSPSMDFEELRRRHDQFKMRQTRTEGAAPRPQTPAPRPVIKPQPKPVKTAPIVEQSAYTSPVDETPMAKEPVFEPVQPQEVATTVEDLTTPFETVAEEIPEQSIPAEPEDIESIFSQQEDIEDFNADDGEQVFNLDDLDEAPAEDQEGDYFEDEEDLDSDKDPNPFDSMLSIFRSAFSKLKRRKAEDVDPEYEEYEDLPDDVEDFGPVEGEVSEPAENGAFSYTDVEASEPVEIENTPAEDIEDVGAIEDIDGFENIKEAEDIQDEIGDFDGEDSTEDFEEDFADDEILEEAPVKKRFNFFGLFKKQPKDEEEIDFDDSDFADDDYEAEEFPEIDSDDVVSPVESVELPEEQPADAAADVEDFKDIPAPVADAESFEDIPAPAADIEDFEDIPAPAADINDLEDLEPLHVKEKPQAPHFDEEDFEDDSFSDEDFNDDSDDSDEFFDDEEEDGENKPSAFRKFLSLFIVREDDDPDDENDEFDEDDGFDFDDDGEWKQMEDIRAEDNLTDFDDNLPLFNDDNHSPAQTPVTARPVAHPAAGKAHVKGGTPMDEKNRVNTDMTELLAASLESQGLSRRERRELAARQAAEEAAKRAAEEAVKVEEPTRVIAPIFVEETQPVVEEPAAEEPAEEASDIFAADEPTRIFKPVSPAPVAPETEIPVSFDEDDDEDDEDEEEETEKKRGGFGFFRKKRPSHEEDEDEEEDEDDEDEEDDEEEEEEKKPRRGLFGKKNRSVKYDEDEEDDEDDEEDEDEYDEYDDFDDDEDDEDDYDDDDEDGPSIGHRILGFFKGLVAIIVCVLVVVIAVNFLDFFNVFSLDPVFERYYNKAPAVFDTLFPSHNFKQMSIPDESITAIDPIDAAVTPVPTDAPAAN